MFTTNPQTGLSGLLQTHKPVYLVYYKATNRFIWFTTNPQTGLDGLLTDLHTGLNVLLHNHKPV